MKVAIVHDWLVGGGAEKVVLEVHRMYPEAPIYTSYATDDWRQKLEGQVVTGFLQAWPFSALRKFIPILRIWWFSGLNLKDYDLIISSTGAEAKGVKTRENQTHICYMHAPTHYYWSRYDEYLENPGFPVGLNWLAKLALKILVGPLRAWDYKAAQRPTHIITNSNYTKEQIKKYYGREANVIHPPVDVERFDINTGERKGFVITGRQTPYKKIDLAVAACTQLNLPLVVIGNGPDHTKLIKTAGPSVNFVTDATDQDVANHLANAEAFIFPGMDDFGIAPVEAMAAGLPVVAYQAGGALDYVIPNQTGTFFNEQTVNNLVAVLENFKASDYSPHDIKQHAKTFSAENFHKNLRGYLNDVLQ